MPDVPIEVAVFDDEAWARVSGRAVFCIATPMRDFAMRVIGRGLRKLVVDLAACDHMDSTFMGVLTMAAIQARERNAEVELVHTVPGVREQINGLGIASLFHFSGRDRPAAWTRHAAAADLDADRQAMTRTMIEAHQALSDAHPDNASRFRNVIDFLRQERNPSSGPRQG